MDSLEPWNMFTNDFVAEETDEILTDEVLAEHRHASEVAQVKQEPAEDSQETEDCNADEDGVEAEVPTALDEEDDDTIFNFGLEPEVAINESTTINESLDGISTFARAAITQSLRSTQSTNKSEGSSRRNFDDTPINYEIAMVYICPACGAEFNAQDVWKRHMNGVHNYNTRRGLNFVQVDKLYHECLECHKHIAMHAMENLLKHKFTHLPFRCTKCRICLRQYKYRQDLMVHLRMTHRDDLLAMTKADTERQEQVHKNGNSHSISSRPGTSLEIKDIKENAVDIYENTYEDIEVKNEILEPDESDIDALAEQASNSFVLPSFLEDALSRSSSHASERQSMGGGGGGARSSAIDAELCEKYITYICPQCGDDFETQTLWRRHIEDMHNFGTRRGLNFQEVNQTLQCMECNKTSSNGSIQHLQLHKFTHLPHKSWLRCKLCMRTCVGQKEMLKHLTKQHRLGGEYVADESLDECSGGRGDEDDDGLAHDGLLMEQSSKSEDRDIYEPHISYMCPQCGKDFLDKKLWRRHIVKVHHLTDLKVLNFKVLNERQVMCRECLKVITNAYGIQNAQQHRITHMPYKAYIRCRRCGKLYTDRKGLVKHLRSVHSLADEGDAGKSQASADFGSTSEYGHLLPPLQPRPLHRSTQPVKEIVKHADVTYEIQYLDEDDDDAPVPELSFERGFAQAQSACLRCDDCGSMFATQRALQTHVREEHEFLNYNNMPPLPELPTNTRSRRSEFASDERSNDVDKDDDELLLMPASGQPVDVEEDISNSSASAVVTATSSLSTSVSSGGGGSSWHIERHFCYLCPACGLEFRAQIEWRQHINEVHNFDKRHFLNFRPVDKFRYQCTECRDIVSNSKLKGLQDHKFRHLPYKLYIKCLHCSTCYNHKPNMVSHLRVRHNIVYGMRATSEREYDCSPQSARPSPRSLAASTASSPSATGSNKPPGLKTVEDCISFHNAVDHESVTYFCPQCNENFDSHVFWRKHIVDEHNLNSRQGLNFRQIDEHHYLCLQCYKRVTVTHTKGAIGQLQSHKFRHLPYKSFRCLSCDGEFVRKQMFFKHLNRETNRCDSAPNPSAEPQQPKQVQPQQQQQRQPQWLEEPAAGTKTRGPGRDLLPERVGRSGTSDALIVNQATFALVCPQCGLQFDSWQLWREHINGAHELGKRAKLNFKRVEPLRHQCLECHEHVNGKKLRDLQIHHFKHLPYGAYIQCRFCTAAYMHIHNMQNHLQQKHPNVVQKHDEYTQMSELQQFEEQDDEGDSLLSLPHDSADSADLVQHLQANQKPQAADLDIEMAEPDEQYLLG